MCLGGRKVKSYPTSSTSYLLRTVLDTACPKEAPIPGYENEKDYVNRNMFNAVRRGRGGKEKEWTDCVQSDIRTFGIAGDWKATALNAEVWVETVTEGGRRFMAAWRKEEVDAARHRQEKREATGLGTLLSQTGV